MYLVDLIFAAMLQQAYENFFLTSAKFTSFINYYTGRLCLNNGHLSAYLY